MTRLRWFLPFGGFFWALLSPSFSTAEQAYEKFHVQYSDSLAPILKKTIGVFTINSYPEGIKRGTELRIYAKAGKGFSHVRTVKVFKETIPVSNCGYESWVEREIIQGFRYPITGRFGSFLRIYYDVPRQSEGWVNLEEIRQEFETSMIALDSIQTPSSFFIDIFNFVKNGERKIYNLPDDGSEFTVLLKDNPKYFVFRILELKDGFAKVAAVLGIGNGDEPRETLGWIKLRDERGVLTIWVMCADLC